MVMNITKIGGSNFVIVPSEFMKVYSLKAYSYEVNVSKDGKKITYTRIEDVDENPDLDNQ